MDKDAYILFLIERNWTLSLFNEISWEVMPSSGECQEIKAYLHIYWEKWKESWGSTVISWTQNASNLLVNEGETGKVPICLSKCETQKRWEPRCLHCVCCGSRSPGWDEGETSKGTLGIRVQSCQWEQNHGPTQQAWGWETENFSKVKLLPLSIKVDNAPNSYGLQQNYGLLILGR